MVWFVLFGAHEISEVWKRFSDFHRACSVFNREHDGMKQVISSTFLVIERTERHRSQPPEENIVDKTLYRRDIQTCLYGRRWTPFSTIISTRMLRPVRSLIRFQLLRCNVLLPVLASVVPVLENKVSYDACRAMLRLRCPRLQSNLQRHFRGSKRWTLRYLRERNVLKWPKGCVYCICVLLCTNILLIW